MDKINDKTKYPFVMIPNDVVDEDKAFSDSTEKMIYFILKRHANLDGEHAFPSMATIAKKAICSESTAKRKVKELIRKGIITKENRFLELGGKTSNLYTITDFTRWVTVNHGEVTVNHGDGSERPMGRVTVNHEEDTLKKTPVKKKNNSRQQVDYDSDFKEFYNLYPKKIDPSLAKRTYTKVRKEKVTHEQIMFGLMKFNEEVQRTGMEKRFIKNPSTWLNAGAYLNYGEQSAKEVAVTKISDEPVTINEEQMMRELGF